MCLAFNCLTSYDFMQKTNEIIQLSRFKGHEKTSSHEVRFRYFQTLPHQSVITHWLTLLTWSNPCPLYNPHKLHYVIIEQPLKRSQTKKRLRDLIFVGFSFLWLLLLMCNSCAKFKTGRGNFCFSFEIEKSSILWSSCVIVGSLSVFCMDFIPLIMK